MLLDYQVTFEFMLDPPITTKGKVSASSAQACARIAVKEAKGRAPRKKWSSLVILLAQPHVLDKLSHD